MRALADTLKKSGLEIVSGGTDSHLVLVDLRPFGITGKAAEAALERAGITCNKNAIPFDPEKPFGHLGHPARNIGRHDPRLRHPESARLRA
jgi:glycine/serine hydroxymethyltransferase